MKQRIVRQVDEFDRQAAKYGLASARELMAGPRRYKWDLIERDVKKLLMRPCRDLPSGSHGKIPEHLVNYLASIFLSCCEVEGRAPSKELLVLISQQLEAASFGLQGREPKSDAQAAAQRMREDDPTISNAKIAKAVGVNKSTVFRWGENGDIPPRQV